MAEYGVDISVRVKRDQVDQLGRLLNAVEKQVGKLNRVKVNLDTSPANRSLDALNNRLREAEQIANRFGGSNKIRQGLGAFSNSIGKLSGELAAVRTAFDTASTAADRQERALELLSGQFKKTRLEGQAFANASKDFFGPALGSLEQRLKEIEKLPRNLFSSGEAIKELTYLQSLAVQGTEEWLTVSKALGRQLEINANIRLGAQRAQGPMPTDPFGTKQLMLPAAGQTSGTFAIVDRQAKTEADINDTLSRRQRIQQKVNDLTELEAEQSERLDRSQRATLNTKTKTYQQDRKAASDRRRDIASNVLIGGAFPLLFGQGVGASLGGALGGGIGARFGGQGGFAGSLVGTFAGQATIDFAIKSAVQLGQALRKPTQNIQELTQFLAIAGTEFESNITTLQKLGMESTASAAALAKLEDVLKAEGYKNVEALSKDLEDLDNTFRQLKLATANLVSKPLTEFLGWLTDVIKLAAQAGAPKGGSMGAVAGVVAAQGRLDERARAATSPQALREAAEAERAAKEQITAEQNRQLNLAKAQFELEYDRLSLTRTELASRQGNLDIQKVQNELTKLGIEYQNEKNKAKRDELQLDIKLLEQQKQQLEAARQNAILLAEREVRKESRSLIAATFQQQVQYNDLLAEAAGLAEGDLANYNKQLKNLDGRAKAVAAINSLQRANALEGVNELHIREDINKQYDWMLTNELEKIKNQRESLKQQIAAYNLGQLQITQQRELANLQTQTQMGLQLAGLQAGTDPRFFGVFGGSRQTQESMGLEMQTRLGLMRTELAALGTQAAMPNLGAKRREELQQQSQALEDQIEIYERYQPAIINASIAQQRFNEAMALTTPVVDSVFESIVAVAEGTKTAQQAFADFLMSIANMLMDTVKQMIAQYIALGIARQFAGIPGITNNGMFGAGAPTETFAGGGIFSGAGPFQFRANGGSVSSGQPYIVGERGPELFVPGAQGNIVPNNAMGGANVTVNVDASGSNVEGNADQANQLGKAIGLAVQQELIKQKRPGGLLAGV